MHKAERVKKRKLIDQLFKTGQSFAIYPYRVFYILQPVTGVSPEVPLQVGVGVSKKHFKKAVHRNRIKRLTREAYRLQKLQLLQAVTAKQHNLTIFFIYTGKEMPTFNEANEKINVMLQRLQQQVTALPN